MRLDFDVVYSRENREQWIRGARVGGELVEIYGQGRLQRALRDHELHALQTGRQRDSPGSKVGIQFVLGKDCRGLIRMSLQAVGAQMLQLLLEAIGRGGLAFRIFRSRNLRPTNDRRPEQQADRELARTYRHQKKLVYLVRCRKLPASGIIYCQCSWPTKERSCAPSLPLRGRESPAIAR